MKNLMIFLVTVLLIASALFWRQVWGIFAGMSVLEAMNTIVTFILHVAVATIAAYAVMLIPEYVLPWLKAFRWKRGGRRRMESGRRSVSLPSMPRVARKDQLMIQMMAQLAKSSPSLRPPQIKRQDRFGEGARDEPIIRLDL